MSRPAAKVMRALAAALFAVALMAPAAQATFPGRSGWIAFEGDPHSPKIYRVHADGSGLEVIANHAGDPAWSPDGRSIAFDDFRTDGLWIMRADGSHARQVPHVPVSVDPAWSPDGKRIVFSNSYGQSSTRPVLFTIRPDGTGRRRVGEGLDPDWSVPVPGAPAGMLAFATCGSYRCHELDRRLETMRPDGSDRTVIGTPTGAGYPAWSPDGASIAHVNVFHPPARGADLFAFDLASGADRRLTFWQPADDEMPWEPAYSPEGDRIVAAQRVEAIDGNALVIYDAATGAELSRVPGVDDLVPRRPAWQALP